MMCDHIDCIEWATLEKVAELERRRYLRFAQRHKADSTVNKKKKVVMTCGPMPRVSMTIRGVDRIPEFIWEYRMTSTPTFSAQSVERVSGVYSSWMR